MYGKEHEISKDDDIDMSLAVAHISKANASRTPSRSELLEGGLFL